MVLVTACGRGTSSGSGPVNPERRQEVPGIFYSHQVDDNLRTYVALPEAYANDALARFPVVYLLDGDWYFDGSHERLGSGGVRGTIQRLGESGRMPPSILVGVGYQGTGDNARGRDFLQAPERFFAFLSEELIPTVDTLFRTVDPPDRTLMGHSDGGLFVMYALFERATPSGTPFRRFVSLSGDFTKDYAVDVFAAEATLAQTLGDGAALDFSLYLGVGGAEETRFLDSHLAMTQRLEARGYRGFDFGHQVYPNLDHGAVVGPGFEDGLAWCFRGGSAYVSDDTGPESRR